MTGIGVHDVTFKKINKELCFSGCFIIATRKPVAHAKENGEQSPNYLKHFVPKH